MSVWDALSACAAVSAGARSLFLSGSALAGSLGFPDLGLVRPDELIHSCERIVAASGAPLIVDIETGFGSLTALARLTVELRRVGVSGVHIEDQDWTGQSVSRRPGLTSIETMNARIAVIREAADGQLGVLARTDVLGADWPFERTLERLAAYRAAGADWTMAVFVRSSSELAATVAPSPAQAIAIAVLGAGGYRPSVGDAARAGCRGILVTGPHAVAHRALREGYELMLGGDIDGALARADSREEVARSLGVERYSALVDQQAEL